MLKDNFDKMQQTFPLLTKDLLELLLRKEKHTQDPIIFKTIPVMPVLIRLHCQKAMDEVFDAVLALQKVSYERSNRSIRVPSFCISARSKWQHRH